MSASRRCLLATAGPVLVSAATLAGAPGPAPVFPDDAADTDVAEVIRRAAVAHVALMGGDLGLYRSLIATSDDFTLMAPFGGTPTRARDLTSERWASIARFFHNGTDASTELVQAWRSADMVVLALVERANVEVGGLPAQDWALRVTLVFRRERGQWLLAHRHADPLVTGISLAQAAELAK